jgi:large subunit ribosomal protein L23
MSKIADVIIGFHISEKGNLVAAQNTYVLKINPKATKQEVKYSVEKFFGVKVLDVNMVKVKPKKRTMGRRIGWTEDFKKAYMKLAESHTISALSN